MKRTSEEWEGKEVQNGKTIHTKLFPWPKKKKKCASVLQYFRRVGINIIHYRQPRQNH